MANLEYTILCKEAHKPDRGDLIKWTEATGIYEQKTVIGVITFWNPANNYFKVTILYYEDFPEEIGNEANIGPSSPYEILPVGSKVTITQTE